MKQEVEVKATLTLEMNANLSKDAIGKKLTNSLLSSIKIIHGVQIDGIREEADIYGNELLSDAPPLFPNGFESWQETHFEIVNELTKLFERDNTLMQSIDGICGLYGIARDYTLEFERINMGREWDGEFRESIWDFIKLKVKDYEQTTVRP